MASIPTMAAWDTMASHSDVGGKHLSKVPELKWSQSSGLGREELSPAPHMERVVRNDRRQQDALPQGMQGPSTPLRTPGQPHHPSFDMS